MTEKDNEYGARIERGIIISATDGYVIRSYDRGGMETPGLDAMGTESYQTGDQVYFFLFNDGTGKVLGKI